jgi:hypothetical protein
MYINLGLSILGGVVSNRGNPRVFFLYPYPTPPNTLPLREGKGYPSDEWRVR